MEVNDDPKSKTGRSEPDRRDRGVQLPTEVLSHFPGCRFLYHSVIITTPLSGWCFDYHTPKKTLYHESTTKINFATGYYAKAHVQFRDRRMSPIEVIDYIANHDLWKATQVRK